MNFLKFFVCFSNGPLSHVDLVDKLQKNVKTFNKNLQTVLKDLIIFEVEKLKSISPPPKYYCYYRKEAEPDFMNWFIKEFNSTNVFLFLAVGDEKTTGNIVLYGDEKAIADLGKQYVYFMSTTNNQLMFLFVVEFVIYWMVKELVRIINFRQKLII